MVWSLAARTAVLVGGLMFTLILALVVSAWSPLLDADEQVVDLVNSMVSDRPWLVVVLQFITDLGGPAAGWILVPAAVVWLLIRRLPRLATYVAVTGLGAAVLTIGVKALVDRTRPLVDTPVLEASGASFPSGHAITATITYGVLLIAFLPVVPVRLRRATIAATVALILAIGLTRVALGVHYPSDVLAGWLLGTVWLAITAVAFHSWRREEWVAKRPKRAEPASKEAGDLAPTAAHPSPLPPGWVSAAGLATAFVMIWGALFGLGLLVTDVLTPVQQVDRAVVDWFTQMRTQTLSPTVVAVSHLGSAIVIIIVIFVAAPLSWGLTRRWGPPLFLTAAAAGEVALYLASSTVVGRPRPEVGALTDMLPPTSSFPSGHVAAAFATYGGIALLLFAWTRSRLSYTVLVIAALAILGVALARLYRGVHYPSDTLASLMYTAAWLAACWWAFRPDRGSPVVQQHSGTKNPQHVPSPSDSGEGVQP